MFLATDWDSGSTACLHDSSAKKGYGYQWQLNQWASPCRGLGTTHICICSEKYRLGIYYGSATWLASLTLRHPAVHGDICAIESLKSSVSALILVLHCWLQQYLTPLWVCTRNAYFPLCSSSSVCWKHLLLFTWAVMGCLALHSIVRC